MEIKRKCPISVWGEKTKVWDSIKGEQTWTFWRRESRTASRLVFLMRANEGSFSCCLLQACIKAALGKGHSVGCSKETHRTTIIKSTWEIPSWVYFFSVGYYRAFSIHSNLLTPRKSKILSFPNLLDQRIPYPRASYETSILLNWLWWKPLH